MVMVHPRLVGRKALAGGCGARRGEGLAAGRRHRRQTAYPPAGNGIMAGKRCDGTRCREPIPAACAGISRQPEKASRACRPEHLRGGHTLQRRESFIALRRARLRRRALLLRPGRDRVGTGPGGNGAWTLFRQLCRQSAPHRLRLVGKRCHREKVGKRCQEPIRGKGVRGKRCQEPIR